MIEQVSLELGRRNVAGDYFTCNGKCSAIAVLLHGFLSSKESTYTIANALQKSGIDSLALDFNGHGSSDGDFSSFTVSRAVEDCKAALEFAQQKEYSNIGLFGFSIGGFVALNTLSQSKLRVDAAVLGSPLSNFGEVFKKSDLEEWRKTNMLRAANLGLNIHLDYSFYEDGVSYDGYDSFSAIEQPVLILHGTLDDVVPISQSEMLMKHLPNAHLFRINGAGHSIFSAPSNSESLGPLLKWFKTYLNPN